MGRSRGRPSRQAVIAVRAGAQLRGVSLPRRSLVPPIKRQYLHLSRLHCSGFSHCFLIFRINIVGVSPVQYGEYLLLECKPLFLFLNVELFCSRGNEQSTTRSSLMSWIFQSTSETFLKRNTFLHVWLVTETTSPVYL